MNTSPTRGEIVSSWEADIRVCEEEARRAFLHADLDTLGRMWAPGYAVNSPLQRVLSREQVLEALRLGRIRHSAYEIEIESMERHGDVVVVMGRDRVEDPPQGRVSHRRFTNVWRLDGGVWRSIARHAHVISPGAGGIPSHTNQPPS